MGLGSASAKRRLMQSVIALVAMMGASAASAVQVTLGSVNENPAATVDVPISVADTSGILGIALSFAYDSTIATATQVNSVPGVTNNCSIVSSLTTGMVVITAACAGGLPAGAQTIFTVRFTPVTNGTTALTFTQTPEVPGGCFLNEGTPSCQPVNGQIIFGPAGPTSTATATATNTAPAATATATATRTGTATNTVAVATATATSTGTPTFTNTAGPSPTATDTRTPTQTATITNTPVSTNTFTPTFTVTDTPTATATRTVTPTRTITNTPNATQTRPPIPVVPSPASPAGVLMIVALGGGLVWALRRVSKPR